MKKSILILTIIITAFLSSPLLKAQTQISGSSVNGVVKPKKTCDVKYNAESFSITGNKTKTYTLARKGVKLPNLSYFFGKTSGKAKATFTIFVDGVEFEQWTFEGRIPTGKKTVQINNKDGKEVVLTIKNHSATNRIKGEFYGTVNTNSMLAFSGLWPMESNTTLTRKITTSKDLFLNLNNSCNNNGTIEVTRLGGNSSATISVYRGDARRGGRLITSQTIAANQTLKRINISKRRADNREMSIEIRDIESGEFLRARIGAWFN